MAVVRNMVPKIGASRSNIVSEGENPATLEDFYVQAAALIEALLISQ